MNIMNFLLELESDEGLKVALYDDATGSPVVPGYTMAGHATIGVGANVQTLPRELIDIITAWQIKAAMADLDNNAPWWRRMSERRQHALLNMSFNMGWPSLFGFMKMLTALELGDYEEAARQVLVNGAGDGPSKYSLDVGSRADRVAKAFRDG